MLTLLQELCAENGVSSWEDDISAKIQACAEPFADTIRKDSIGNLIVFKKGKKSTGNKLLLSAHMDEVGLMITRIEKDGFLRFDTVGGIDRRVLLGKKVYIGEKRVPGVIGTKPIHLTTSSERKKIPQIEKLYIDIGAKDKQEAEHFVTLGDVAAFDGNIAMIGNNQLKAKAIDDRIGCTVMLKLLKEELPMDCTFVFSCQEEVGTRGAFGYAFSEQPEIALVLEGTTASDIPGAEEQKKICEIGKGPVISLIDGGTIYDRSLFELLRDLADENQIPWQIKHMVAGGTDARTIQRSKAGVRVAGISCAVRYIHSPSSVCDVRDVEPIFKLAKLFIAAIAEKVE